MKTLISDKKILDESAENAKIYIERNIGASKKVLNHIL